MSRDYLYGTDLMMEQKEDLYHFNSDTVFLASFMDIKHSDSVLDVGCAQGALLLYASVFKPSSLTGIDLFEEVIDACGHNLQLNHIDAQLTMTPVQKHEGQYTVILCNPPFFETENPDLINGNPVIAAARHASYLPLEDLFSSVKRLLKDNGRFYLVHRASAVQKILLMADQYGLHARRMRFAYESIQGNAKSVVMEFRFRKAVDCVIEPCAYLDDRDTFKPKGGSV